MKQLIFDGSNILWRAHWISRKYSPDHVYQDINVFMSIIHGICVNMNCFNVYIAWDDRELRGQANPRATHLQQYKQNRTKEAACYQHIQQIKDLTSALGITHVRPYALEADDVVSVLCDVLPGEKIIISADQDLAQLVSSTVSFYNIVTKVLVTLNNFTQYFPVPVERFVTYKCILGDSSDNIPGVPKYGVKRASKLTQQYHEDPNSVPSDIIKIIESNRCIIDLKHLITSTEVDFITDQLNMSSINMPLFRLICAEYNLNKTAEMDVLGYILNTQEIT